MPTTLVAFGAALASSSDGVQDMLVAEVCVAIVVSAREPNFALSVCEKELDAEHGIEHHDDHIHIKGVKDHD